MPDLETLDAPEVELSDLGLNEPEPDETLDLESTEETDGEADPLASLDDDALLANPRIAAMLAKRDAEEAQKLEQARKDTERRIRQSEQDKAQARLFREQQEMGSRQVINLAKDNLREVFKGLKQRLLDGDDTAEVSENVLDEHARVLAEHVRVNVGNEQFTTFQRWAESWMPGFLQTVPRQIQESYWRHRHAGDHSKALLVLQDAMMTAAIAATEKRILQEQQEKADKEAKAKAEADAARGARRVAVGAPAPSRPVGVGPAPDRLTNARRIFEDFSLPTEKRREAWRVLYPDVEPRF
jgi:hypothetical protein